MRHFLLLNLVGGASAAAVDFTGHLVDQVCWGQVGHRAKPTRELPLDIAPENHTVECLRDISVCFEDLDLLDQDPNTGLWFVKYQFNSAKNPDGLKALQNLLLADKRQVTGDPSLKVPNGAPDVSIQNGGNPMEKVHITATADDADGTTLTDISVNVEGSAVIFTKDSVPQDETPATGFGDSNLVVNYELVAHESGAESIAFRVELATASGGWMAVGVSKDGTMHSGGDGSDMVICEAGDLEVRRYWVTQQVKPTGGELVPMSSCNLEDGKQVMMFDRFLEAEGDQRTILASGVTQFIYAYSSSSAAMTYHGGNKKAIGVDISSGGTSSVSIPAPVLVLVHAAFMLISWGFLLPLGAAAARVLRNQPKQVGGKPLCAPSNAVKTLVPRVPTQRNNAATHPPPTPRPFDEPGTLSPAPPAAAQGSASTRCASTGAGYSCWSVLASPRTTRATRRFSAQTCRSRTRRLAWWCARSDSCSRSTPFCARTHTPSPTRSADRGTTGARCGSGCTSRSATWRCCSAS